MSWLAKRRFNYIDCVAACIIVQCVETEKYIAALLILVIATVISVFVEMKFGEQS